MILVDTHVALWSDQRSDRLGPSTTLRLSVEDRVWFSAISTFELAVKRALGRIDVPRDVHRRFEENGLVELPFASTHAMELDKLSGVGRHDPFDRALLAQALAERVPFLTADRHLLGLGHDWILDARS